MRSLGSVRGEGGNLLTYSERSYSQQGLVATCKDPVCEGNSEARGGFRIGA